MSNRRRRGRLGGASGGAPPEDGSAFRGMGSHIQFSIEERTPKLITTACRIPDVDQGRKKLTKLLNSACGAKFGAPMTRIDRLVADLDAERTVTTERLAQAREIDVATPDYLPASRVNHGRSADDHKETRWASWQMRHKAESSMIVLLLPMALGASAYTAYANLIGTGLPVFLENPVLPISMAMLAPMASLSFKTMWHSLKSERARASFTGLLNWTTLGLALSFTAMFADQYHGLSAGPVAGGLFDETSQWDEVREAVFTALTLLTEMAVGTVLAHRLDKIAAGYSPNYWIRNLDSESVQARIGELEERLANQSTQLAELEGSRAEYIHSLNLQVDIATLAYDARRARVEDDIL